jgi:transposase
MTEQLTIHHERVDDIPLLLAQLDRMQVANLLDECFPTHGNWDGLSLGQIVSGWLAFILSEANHRMSHVQEWAQRRLQTLQVCLSSEVRALDFSDDRLAAALDYLSDDARWQNFERRLNEHTLRVYDLRPQRVRVDATTAKYFGRMTEDGLFQFGHSKDHRPDLPQLKVNLSVLDPLGLPVTTTVVSGNCADDPLYVPEIKQAQTSLQGRGLTFIGDAKMAALATRAYIAQSGDYYLCPLPATQVGAEQMQRLLRPVFEQRQELVKVYRQTPDQRPGQEREVIAEGYEVAVEMEGALDDQPILWQERRLIVRSLAWSEGQQRALDKRINQAQAEIAALNLRRQGKKVVTDEAELRACGEKILATNRVSGLLTLDCRTSHHQRRRRRYRQRPAAVNVERRVRIEATVDHQAVETAKARLGWRVYASNQGATELSLEQAVVAYREEYLVERGFGRLKGKELSLTPLYLETDERVTGLLRVLVIALRVLCLVEFSLRRELQATGEKLAGIYPGNPKRATQRPTTEMMLRVFEGLTLTMIEHGGQVQRHLTPLSPVQERILHLLGLSPEIYLRLAHHASKLQSSKLLLKMSEP